MEYSYVNPEWKQRQKRSQRHGVGIAVLCSMVTMATVVGLFGGMLLTSWYLESKPAAELPAVTAAPTYSVENTTATEVPAIESAASSATATLAADGTYTRAQICEIAAPSVVGIDTVTLTTYWGQTYEVPASGSGVILTSDGYIATCAHVIEDATKITVTLNDDTTYAATLVGADTRNDIAIIKIEATGLVAAEIGNSDMLTVGEDVIAIGNPLGELRGTATSGIISAIRRTVVVENTEMELVQTDAAISPGNSGGGLFNASGKLIGIVNAKASGDNAEGLAFAIPINNVLNEINDLLQYGYVTGKAELGVVTQNVSLRSGYGFWGSSSSSCVQVVSVTSGSAAEQAGIQSGDLILSLNGTRVTSNSVLSDLVAGFYAGDRATLVLQRDGQQFEVTVTFDEYKPKN